MARPENKIGPYTLVHELGHGRFGVVWQAEKRTAIATTCVALKLPRDEDVDLEALRQEASIWAQASGHTNVLPIIDADVYDGRVAIVSEYAPDGSLTKWLRQHDGRAPSVGAAVNMTLQILAGLEYLHEKRIIHRDIKPDNILLQGRTPRLADFGLACVLRTDPYSEDIKGTLAYMAPEAFRGKRNEQTDVWSVAVILYRMLSGHLPYEQTDIAALIDAIRGSEPPPLPTSIPKSLRQVVVRALKRDTSRRYGSAAEMRRALLAASREMWPREAAETPGERGTLRKAVLVVFLCAVGIALTLWGILPRTPATTLSLDGMTRATANSENNVELRDARTGEVKRMLNRNGAPIFNIRFSRDGNFLAVVGGNGVEVWDARTGAGKRTFSQYKSSAIYAIGFTRDNKLLMIALTDERIDTLDIEP